jgi:hypothetical protein
MKFPVVHKEKVSKVNEQDVTHVALKTLDRDSKISFCATAATGRNFPFCSSSQLDRLNDTMGG